MTRTVRWLAFSSLVGGGAWLFGAQAGHDHLAAQQTTPVTVTRMFTGQDGLTHREPMNIPFAQLINVAGVQFNRAQVNRRSTAAEDARTFGWHNAPHRRYVVTLSGKADIETSGGQKFTADPAHILLAEDLTGKGHRYTARPVGPEDWVTIFIEVDQPRQSK